MIIRRENSGTETDAHPVKRPSTHESRDQRATPTSQGSQRLLMNH